MRDDILVKEVLDKCNVLKSSNFWLPEPSIRPRAWIDNFEVKDKGIAAFLLDKFTFYNHMRTNDLLVATYNSIGDGLSKGPLSGTSSELIESLSTAVFTLVTGENPNPTDSGHFFCRLARQNLEIPEDHIFTPEQAIAHCSYGNTIVFLDDFIGSGDQFIKTWKRRINGSSFEENFKYNKFTAIYLAPITTEVGLKNIHDKMPNIAVCNAHILGKKSSIQGMEVSKQKRDEILRFLGKYSNRLEPKEDYIANVPSYKIFGYHNLGLMFGFEHSIPDATLPIFWAPGKDWEPLIERT